MICQKCSKEFVSNRSLGNHKKSCWYKKETNIQKLKQANKIKNDLICNEYNFNPKKCLQCQSVIPFRKRKYSFCNNSCSATYNNLHRDRIKQKIECKNCNKLFIPIPNNTIFCSLQCSASHRKNKKIKNDKLLFEKGELTYRGRIKIFVKERDGEKCSSCHKVEWLDQKIPLWLDHIDGNASNNNPSNFRLICPNCDSLNSTFGGKNRGNGRRSKGLKPWA
jgi:hypothetical protein